MKSLKQKIHCEKLRLLCIGRPVSLETREKMRLAKLGKKGNNKGKHWVVPLEKRTLMGKGQIGKKRYTSELTRAKISKTQLERAPRGEKSHRWIKDREQLSKRQKRNDYAYLEWGKQCKNRDRWKCKMSNQDCNGQLEVHHILNWVSYPELRYDVNNGITLCHAHHPRGRVKEKQMSPYFMELLSFNKNSCQ